VSLPQIDPSEVLLILVELSHLTFYDFFSIMRILSRAVFFRSIGEGVSLALIIRLEKVFSKGELGFGISEWSLI